MSPLLERTIGAIGPLDEKAMDAARTRQDNLTKPAGSLGRLEALSVQLAGIQGRERPQIQHKAIFTLAADHGVAAEGVSAYPQEVTAQMVLNFLRGGAAINVLARLVGARVIVADLGVASALPAHPQLRSHPVARGSASLARGPAMTLEQARAAIETGIRLVEEELGKGLDAIATGDMGIANTTPSAAIAAAITGLPTSQLTGRGTGIDDARLAHKVAVIEQGLALNRPDPAQALEVLAKVGGFEIGGLAGVMLAGAAHRLPVVIDGFISGAAALIAAGLCPQAKAYFIASHVSVEPGHRLVLEHLGLRPLVNLDLRLGEGTGAALALNLVEAAARILSEMATFGEAGVSESGSGPE